MSPAPRTPHPVPDHIPTELHDAFAWTEGSPVRGHCPYKLGDPVKLHGHSGEQPGHRRTGFRGWVVATVGATILTGITTDGEEWWEEWGRLEPADTPVRVWGNCTCCCEERRPLRRAESAQRRARGEQLDMFGEVLA